MGYLCLWTTSSFASCLRRLLRVPGRCVSIEHEVVLAFQLSYHDCRWLSVSGYWMISSRLRLEMLQMRSVGPSEAIPD